MRKIGNAKERKFLFGWKNLENEGFGKLKNFNIFYQLGKKTNQLKVKGNIYFILDSNFD